MAPMMAGEENGADKRGKSLLNSANIVSTLFVRFILKGN
jgi:hypothetical protein